MIDQDSVVTKFPCPACAHCALCHGTHEVTCYRCPAPHGTQCPACELCGLCQGAHLVSREVRESWLNDRPTDPPPKAA